MPIDESIMSPGLAELERFEKLIEEKDVDDPWGRLFFDWWRLTPEGFLTERFRGALSAYRMIIDRVPGSSHSRAR